MEKSESEYLIALSRISEAITSDLYLEDILKLIVHVTASVMNAKTCALWLVEKDSQELRIRATQALSRDYLKERAIKVGEGIVGLVAQKRKPMTILNVLEDERYKEKSLAKKEGFASMISVPMIVKDAVVGVVNCYTDVEHKFTKHEVDLISTVSNQAAVAIHNTELMVKTQVIQEELESRKKVEKAKGILMNSQGVTEEAAFKLIRKASMDKRVTMKAIAEAIILANEINN
jgi:two-component system, response regulator PdtaR